MTLIFAQSIPDGVPDGLAAFMILVSVGLLGLLLHAILFTVIDRRASQDPSIGATSLLRHGRQPIRLLLPLLLIALALPPVLPEAEGTARIFAILVVLSISWTVVALSQVLQDILLDRFRIDVADNLQARKVHTQLDLVRKIFVVVVVVVTAALVLMTFETFRTVGTGLLASAGIAGLILGLAAQKTLGNLLAGFQIALTQPIRLDDVVVVEGEWGRVEEITLTYVVVRIWDLRRLVLPISYFIERPFQNWTRTSATILGTVFLHVDYTVPLDAVRNELRKQLEASPHWDGDVCVLHVVEARERTVEVRALMSALDSGAAWELRCHVREKLLEYLQREHPETLPRLRAELHPIARNGPPDEGPRLAGA